MGETVSPEATKVVDGVWRLTLRVPVGRWFIRILSPHCAALVETLSISGESRSFITGLYRGNAATLDAPSNYVAGTLPTAGWTSIYASHEGSPIDAIHPILEGGNFYLTGLKPTTYLLVIAFGLDKIFIPLDFTGRPGAGNIQHLTIDQIRNTVQKGS